MSLNQRNVHLPSLILLSNVTDKRLESQKCGFKSQALHLLAMSYTPHFIVLHIYCAFYKLKVCDPESSMSISIIFPTAVAQLVSLGDIWVILAVFQTFSLVLDLLR